MARENEFKAWLEQSGAQTVNGRNTRAFAVRTIERKLEELGMPFRNLDQAWEADRFESLRERLRSMREDAHDGGQDYRILMPDSENPHNRLSNWGSWLGQYGRFLDGEPPGPAKDADRIRQYVLEHDIEPAREEGRGQVEVIVRDVNAALGLKEAWPNICQALAGRKFRELAQVPPPERIGADQSSATIFRFDLSDGIVDRAALEQARERFLAACPDFRSFADPGTGWAEREKAYKVAASERVTPVNLILYGPPGTGKTYCTTSEAVRLCGEPVPEDREALVQTYQRLLAAGRIEFVTFHQSMSYEDFVEGRQPMTGSDEDDASSSAGFRLETVTACHVFDLERMARDKPHTCAD